MGKSTWYHPLLKGQTNKMKTNSLEVYSLHQFVIINFQH
jgi:hypothetical protein